jgi:hypothetical protein
MIGNHLAAPQKRGICVCFQKSDAKYTENQAGFGSGMLAKDELRAANRLLDHGACCEVVQGVEHAYRIAQYLLHRNPRRLSTRTRPCHRLLQ